MLKKSLHVALFLYVTLSLNHLACGQTQSFSSHISQEFYDGNFQSVVHFYETSGNVDSLSVHTYYLIGRSYQELLKLPKALHLYQKAFRLDSSSTIVLSAIGITNEKLGNLEKAEKTFINVLRVDSTNIPIRLALGRLYMKRQKWRPAVQTFQKLISGNSASILHARLGYCYFKLGDIGKALSHLEESHKLNPRNSRVTLQLSRIYSKKKQWEKGLRVIHETLHFHPTNARLWLQQADINFNRDSMQTAAANYKKVLELKDTTAVTLRKLGTCRVILGNYKQAIKKLLQAYLQNPKDAVTNYYLGIAFRKTDQLDRSLFFLSRANDLGTTDLLLNTLKQLAQTYDAKQNLSKALGAYKLALNLDPELNEMYFRLAVLYDTYYKDKSVAMLYYHKYLDESNDDKQPKLKEYAAMRIESIKKWLFIH